MFPVLFEFGEWSIPAYGFFAALGYGAALFLIRHLARQAGLPPNPFSNLCLLALLTGIIGARALFVLTHFEHFRAHPEEIFSLWSGGLVFYGGFLLALPACLLFLRYHRLPLLRSLDVLAPGLALGHAIGRIGCFAAGCCHGRLCPYPWGVSLHSSLVETSLRGRPIHPTQLYESMGLMALCGGLLWWGRRNPKPGSLALGYVVGYAALRAVVEAFRGDLVRGFVPGTGLATSQFIALALFAVGGSLFLFRRFRRHH